MKVDSILVCFDRIHRNGCYLALYKKKVENGATFENVELFWLPWVLFLFLRGTTFIK